MKRPIIITLLLTFSFLCHAQLKAPVQTDTLYVESMKYHFEEIQPANWPFTYVVRTTDTFKFGDQSFSIKESMDYGYAKFFILIDNEGVESELEFNDKDNPNTIKFSDYIIECTREKVSNVTKEGRNVTTSANAHLQGRQLLGSIPSPICSANASGVVVVDIWVDNYGAVQKAVVGDGTTVTDKSLWNAALVAAKKAHFSMSSDAPALQQGSVTYFFKGNQN